MALFGEKYGEWVRVVEIDGVSRELCGGTHVANTAEVGIFKISAEGSSAANVRRIEAISGPAAIDWFREREAQLREVGELLGSAARPAGGARARRSGCKRPAKGKSRPRGSSSREEADRLLGEASSVGPFKLVALGSRLPTKSSCWISPTGSSQSSERLGDRAGGRRGGAEVGARRLALQGGRRGGPLGGGGDSRGRRA